MPIVNVVFDDDDDEEEEEVIELEDEGSADGRGRGTGAAGTSSGGGSRGVPFVPEMQPPGLLPIAHRKRTLSPPPTDWEWNVDVLMADGATQADAAVMSVFAGRQLPNPDDGACTSHPICHPRCD